MSKYGDFEVVGTARLKPKKSTSQTDEDGMREYSYLKCPHCHKDDIEIVSNNMDKQKYTVIREHIMVCPSFTGERPPKRNKTSGTASVPQSTAIVPVTNGQINNHTSQSDELVELKKRMADMEEKQKASDAKQKASDAKQETTEAVLAQQQLWWGDLARLMGFEPPTDPPVLLDKCRELREKRTALIEFKKDATLLLQQKDDVIQTHQAMIEQKDATIIAGRQMIEGYQQQVEDCKQQLEAKDSELSMSKAAKEEAERRMEEVSKTVSTLSTRTDRLQKERDSLNAKYTAALRGHEQAVRNHGKHGHSQLIKLQHSQKRAFTTMAMSASMEASTANAVAIEKQFAARQAKEATERREGVS